jgi:integrase
LASIRKRGKNWYVRLRDENGVQREIKGGPDKGVAKSLANELDAKIRKIKLGILDPRDVSAIEAERVGLVQHVEDYLRYLAAKGCVPDHVKAVRIKLDWLLRKTGAIRLSQLRPSLVVEALAELKAAGRSDRTRFHYATVSRSFSAWLAREHRTKFNLLEDLERPAVVTEGERPALSPEQTARLIEFTATGPPRCGISGQDRSWLYTLAATTGFRRLELEALTPESFDLVEGAPMVKLSPRQTKNRKGAMQPLPGHLVAELRGWLATKPPGRALFPPVDQTAVMLRRDLRAAGIPPDGFCFHSLRHTFVSGVVASGASIKVCMELARHSKPDLTFRRYSHSQAEDRSKAVNSLPTFFPQQVSGRDSTGRFQPCPDETGMDPAEHAGESSKLLDQAGAVPGRSRRGRGGARRGRTLPTGPHRYARPVRGRPPHRRHRRRRHRPA